MAHSPDGEWFWDGGHWAAAWSPDRAWWWNGARWIPAATPAPVAFEYQPTVWTRRLQLIVVGLTLFGMVVAAFSIPALAGPFQQGFENSIASQPGITAADAAQLRQALTATLTGILIAVGVLTVIVYAVFFIGVWKLWRWIFWYFVVTGFLAALAIPQDIIYGLGVGPYHLPPWYVVINALQALTWLAVAIWMVMLNRRYGNWARRRVPVGGAATHFQ